MKSDRLDLYHKRILFSHHPLKEVPSFVVIFPTLRQSIRCSCYLTRQQSSRFSTPAVGCLRFTQVMCSVNRRPEHSQVPPSTTKPFFLHILFAYRSLASASSPPAADPKTCRSRLRNDFTVTPIAADRNYWSLYQEHEHYCYYCTLWKTRWRVGGIRGHSWTWCCG